MKQDSSKQKKRGGRRKKSANNDTRQTLLEVARVEFAAHGLEGARVDRIAKKSEVNKQLVYHYFGSKDDLYTAVLEEAYHDIREKESALDLSDLPAKDAMRNLIEFSFDYLDENRDFVALVTDENTHQGEHLNGSQMLEPMNRPILDLIKQTLDRGDFKVGLDPLQVYVSVAALSFFYFSNAYTLSRIFGRDLLAPAAVAERKRHVVDFVMASIKKET